MAKTKHTALIKQPSAKKSLSKDSPSPNSSSFSQTISPSSNSSQRTLTPPPIETSKRVSKPTSKVLDKGKAPMVEPEKKKRKCAPTKEKFMGDAMKASKAPSSTKKPSPKKAKKAKKTPSPASEHDDLHLLIPNKEAREEYLLKFAKRKIQDARVVDFNYFDQEGFVFQNILRFYGMVNFLGKNESYYPRLIRIF